MLVCTVCHKELDVDQDEDCYTDLGDGPYCDTCYKEAQDRLDRVRMEHEE